MFPERGTRKDELRDAFTYIMRERLEALNNTAKKNSRCYTYGEIAAVSRGATDPRDWKHDGWARNQIVGLDGRSWLLGEFRLWWKADEVTHGGLLFTSDCRTGVYWYEDIVADRTHRDARALLELAREAERLQTTFRDYFRNVRTGGKRLMAGADKLNELRDPSYLRMLGIGDDPEAEPT